MKLWKTMKIRFLGLSIIMSIRYINILIDKV